MVKHQRRSHQRGIHSSELDDCTSESGSDESPSTPKSNAMHWPPAGMPINGMSHGHGLHRAASFADFGQQMNPLGMHQAYNHRHSLSQGPHEYHGVPMQQEQQHPGTHMLHRTASLPQQPYYVTEHHNPGVATMNTHPVSHQYHQVPRQPVERIAVDIPYTQAGLAGSIESSPSSFSASGRSPSTQDGFYTHQPPQAATYALQAVSPVVEQQGPMMPYAPQSLAQAVQPQQMAQPPPPPQQHTPTEQYQPTPPQQGQEWYPEAGVQYQQPIEVTAVPPMTQIPSYGQAVYVPWAEAKLEYESGIQMPSQRIEQM